jgi:hypothetical protein
MRVWSSHPINQIRLVRVVWTPHLAKWGVIEPPPLPKGGSTTPSNQPRGDRTTP